MTAEYAVTFFSSLSLIFFCARTVVVKDLLIILPIFYSLIGTWVGFGFADDVLQRVDAFNITKNSVMKTHYVFLVSAWSFYFGLCIKRPDFSRYPNVYMLASFFERIPKLAIVCFAFFTVALVHFAYPLDKIYFRQGYASIYDGGTVLKSLVSLLVPVCSLLLPFHKNKFVRYLLFIIIVFFVQGLNKRLLLLIPIFYYLGSYIRDRRFSLKRSTAFAIMTVFFAGYVLEYRLHSYQGVIPNLQQFFESGVDLSSIWMGMNYLFGFSFYSTMVTSNFFDVTLSSIYLSINPLPGSMLNLESIVSEHKISKYAPYSALGTLGIIGIPAVFLYFFMAGLIFKLIFIYFPRRFRLLLFVVIVLFLVFTVMSLQYNLRTSVRFLYYSVMFFFIIKIFSMFILSLKRRRPA